jgi:phage FluMu protein Com
MEEFTCLNCGKIFQGEKVPYHTRGELVMLNPPCPDCKLLCSVEGHFEAPTEPAMSRKDNQRAINAHNDLNRDEFGDIIYD